MDKSSWVILVSVQFLRTDASLQQETKEDEDYESSILCNTARVR
jgi:hypothetical protein